MLCRAPIFTLLAAAMTFAAEGVGNITNITVNATVDSRIDSVTVKAGVQMLGTVTKNGSDIWKGWGVDTAYTPTFTGVATGYEGRWSVSTNGVVALSGGTNNTITIPDYRPYQGNAIQGFNDCQLLFYGEPKQYTVTLNLQAGIGGSSSVTATYDAAMPTATMPTRTGYMFGGYYTEENGGGTQYYNADGTSAHAWDIAEPGTLYAKWTPIQYEVTLNKLEGSGGTDSVEATYDVAMPSISPPTRDGYTFGGYYTASSGGGVQYYNADGTSAHVWDKNVATTLYAKWTPGQYEVTLDKQEGSGGTDSVRASYGSAMPVATMPTRQGYTFGGYWTERNGGGTQYYQSNGGSACPWDKTSALTLYAKWTAKQYTLIIDPNGGMHGGMSEAYELVGRLETGTTNHNMVGSASRQGYDLLGFYGSSTGGSLIFDVDGSAVGGTYWDGNGALATFKGLADASESFTVYARWRAGLNNVEFVLNGGTFTNGWTTTMNYMTGVGLTLPGTGDVFRVNYSFKGWYVNEEWSGSQVTAIGSTETGPRTFYAKWDIKSYTISFHANGGRGQGLQTVPMTESPNLRTVDDLNIAAPTGYTFKEWNTEEDGSGDSYADGEVVYDHLTDKDGVTMDLYAQWQPNTCMVAFNANGGTSAMDPIACTYDEPTNLPPCTFTRTGHAFERWSSDTNYNYQTKYYADGAEVTNLTTELNAAVTLYANWTGIVYTVSFDANGAEGSMDSMSCTYDVATNLPACAFTRAGWGFAGWATHGAQGVQFADCARVTNFTATAGAEVSLVACWTGVTYAVTLDARDWRGDGMMTNRTGETVSVLTNLYTVGDAWVLPVPMSAKEHLTFVGWKDNWGQMVGDGALVPLDSDGVTNLVAVWSDCLAAAVDAPQMEFGTFGTEGAHGYPNESPYSSMWFAQPNFVYGSTNAVQSGMLPMNTGDTKLYISWLTTKVKGKGVMSFSWKCDAKPPIVAPEVQREMDGWAGDIFRFGFYDSVHGITNEVARLTNHVDWCYVACTNEIDSEVAFAWAFVYADGDDCGNGGGTGWVDRVTWTPEGSAGTLAFLSISGDERLEPGDSAAYTCTAMMSDGLTKQVTPTWSIESGTSYADLDSSGVLTARATDVLRTVKIKASYTEGDMTVIAAKTVTIAPLHTYTVTFDPNGGSGVMGSLNCVYDVATNLPACTFTRDGWGFAGWATNRTESVLFADGARVSNLAEEGNLALYACWTGVTYAVTLDANGGTLANGSGESVIFVTVGSTWTLPSPTPSDASFVFDGWTYGEEQPVSSGDEVPPPSAGITRLVATWTKADPLAVAVEAPELHFDTFGTVGAQGKPNEMPYSAPWSEQSTVFYEGTNAVQSGQLPVANDPDKASDVYVSWLTTTVEGKGVLSFWWKRNAKALEYDDLQPVDECRIGDTLRFGLYDSEKGITNEIARLTENSDWLYVVYTNESDSVVSFAWPFVFIGYDHENGGGTGWVDRVTWMPEGGTTPDEPQPHTGKYTVTFDANGGKGGWTKELDYGSNIVVPTVTLMGYTFTGWSPAVPAMVPASNVTYVAQWMANSYTVSFDANGGEGVMPNQENKYDLVSRLVSNAFTRTDHTFDGWATNAMGEVVFADGEAVSNLTAEANGSVTLYAHWTATGGGDPDPGPVPVPGPVEPEQEWTVTFDANGGAGTMAVQTFTNGVEQTLSPATFARTGYTFIGWASESDDDVIYEDGEAVTLVTNTMLYAAWTPNTYTVKFDANGGDGDMADQSFTYDLVSPLSSNVFTKSNNAFDGWATATDGNVVYADGAAVSNLTVEANGSVTLYARWTATGGGDPDPGPVPGPVEPEQEWTVTFDANGGAGEMAEQTFTNGIEQALSPTAFSRTGYTFIGWATESDDDVIYEDGEAVTLVTNTMLYAAWTPNTYTVTFDKNGGEGEMAILTNTYDLVSCLTSNAFTYAGHSFDGWATNETGEVVFADGAAVSNLTAEANCTVTLYAQWTEDETPPDDPTTVSTYTVTFNANGGEGVMSDQTFTNDVVSCLSSNAFTYADHTFVGWATNATDEAVFADGAAVSNLIEVDGGVVTLYAVWQEQELSPVERTLKVGEYYYEKLQDLGYAVPADGAPYSVVAKGLPAGLKLKYNAAVKKKVKGKTVVVQKAKTEWWIEGVPTAALDFFTNPPYLVITTNGVAETYALPLEVEAQEVAELEDLALGQSVNTNGWLAGVGKGWSVSGLPTGLKFATKKVTKKSGKKTVTVAEAYAVYGKTTKAGLFTITAKKKHGAYYETMKFRVLVTPKKVDTTRFGEDLTNITTMAYVPINWNLESGEAVPFVPSSVGGKVAKITGLPTGLALKGQVIKGTPTKPGTYVVTFTKNVKSGKKTVAKTAQILWMVEPNDVVVNLGFNDAGGVIESGVVGLKYGDLLAFSATKGATVTANGLPAGMKLVKLDDGGYAFTGFTTKAGTYLVTVKATLKGRSVTQRLMLKVEGLPVWAKGTFNGVVRGSGGLATITVSSVGKISGKFYEGGTNWTISAASYTSATSAAAPAGGMSAGDAFMCTNVVAKYAYKVTKTVKGKKKTETKYVTRTFTLAVSPVPVVSNVPDVPIRGEVRMEEVRLAEAGSSHQADGATEIDAWQNLWGRADYKALGKKLFTSKSGKKTLAYATFPLDVYTNEVGQVYFLKKGDDTTGLTYLLGLSLKVTTAGAVTATLSYDTGKTKKDSKTKKTVKVIYKTTCQSVLVPLAAADAESFVGAVPLYFASSVGNNFKGFAGQVDYPFDGRSVSEQEP